MIENTEHERFKVYGAVLMSLALTLSAGIFIGASLPRIESDSIGAIYMGAVIVLVLITTIVVDFIFKALKKYIT
jgi:hypothetical protein